MCSLILLVVCGLIARMLDLAVIERPFLQQQGDARALRLMNIPAFRGMITDRNGYPLAISTSMYSVWINPKEFSFDRRTIKSLANLLAMPVVQANAILDRYKNKNREFAYVKREISPELAKKIKYANINGVYLQQDYKRFYPEAEVAAHVIGFTNIDDRGQEGLELAYDNWLTGSSGKKMVVKDRLGHVINEVQTVQKQTPGNDLVLSINRRIQYIAYRALMEGVKKNSATSGSAVVMDTKTGEILAMVNQPSFNPNKLPKEKSALRNRAVTDMFEPGSTIKSFSMAVALSSKLYQPDSVIDTRPGWMQVEHHTVRDEHAKGPLTLTQVLQLSSDVGTSKVILSLPPNRLWTLLHQMGFGASTGISFPGEQPGWLVQRTPWHPFALATLSFGYGLSVNTLQLAHAYATIANDGVKVPVSLLKVDNSPVGERILDSHVTQELTQMLQTVVAKKGTGEQARVPGYQVAGKTGTALVAGAHGYESHQYVASFVGFAPASHPRLVVAVVVHDPQGKGVKHQGGYVAAPIFREIMESALRILNVAPDDAASLQDEAEVSTHKFNKNIA